MVHLERPSEHGFDSLQFELPGFGIKESVGFSDEEVVFLQILLKTTHR